MNALERAILIGELREEIGEGTDKDLDWLVREKGYEPEDLDVLTRRAIEESFFTCDKCCYSLLKEEMSETEAGDGFLCKECGDE